MPSGNPEGGGACFNKEFERQMDEGPGNGTSVYGNFTRGTWKKGSFTGNPGGYEKEGSGTGHLSP